MIVRLVLGRLDVYDVSGIVRSFVLLRALSYMFIFFFFNDTATTEIYTRSLVGSVRCV